MLVLISATFLLVVLCIFAKLRPKSSVFGWYVRKWLVTRIFCDAEDVAYFVCNQVDSQEDKERAVTYKLAKHTNGQALPDPNNVGSTVWRRVAFSKTSSVQADEDSGVTYLEFMKATSPNLQEIKYESFIAAPGAPGAALALAHKRHVDEVTERGHTRNHSFWNALDKWSERGNVSLSFHGNRSHLLAIMQDIHKRKAWGECKYYVKVYDKYAAMRVRGDAPLDYDICVPSLTPDEFHDYVLSCAGTIFLVEETIKTAHVPARLWPLAPAIVLSVKENAPWVVCGEDITCKPVDALCAHLDANYVWELCCSWTRWRIFTSFTVQAAYLLLASFSQMFVSLIDTTRPRSQRAVEFFFYCMHILVTAVVCYSKVEPRNNKKPHPWDMLLVLHIAFWAVCLGQVCQAIESIQ